MFKRKVSRTQMETKAQADRAFKEAIDQADREYVETVNRAVEKRWKDSTDEEWIAWLKERQAECEAALAEPWQPGKHYWVQDERYGVVVCLDCGAVEDSCHPEICEPLEKVQQRIEVLEGQICKLGDFFQQKHPGWISEGGAVDNAIRQMAEMQQHIAKLKTELLRALYLMGVLRGGAFLLDEETEWMEKRKTELEEKICQRSTVYHGPFCHPYHGSVIQAWQRLLAWAARAWFGGFEEGKGK